MNGDDLADWEAGYGSTSATHMDGDGDGDVDASDFLAWQQQDGGGVSGVATGLNTAVPEPNSFMLLLAAIACSLSRRRRT